MTRIFPALARMMSAFAAVSALLLSVSCSTLPIHGVLLPSEEGVRVEAYDLDIKTAVALMRECMEEVFPHYEIRVGPAGDVVTAYDRRTETRSSNTPQSTIATRRMTYDHVVTVKAVLMAADDDKGRRGILFDLSERGMSGISRSVSASVLSKLISAFDGRTEARFISLTSTAPENKPTRNAPGVRIDLELPEAGLRRQEPIDVLDINYDETIDVAFEVAQSAFPDARVEVALEKNRISVLQEDGRDAFALTIEPRILINKEDRSDYGTLYRFSGKSLATPARYNSVDQAKSRFAREFWTRNQDTLGTRRLYDYRLIYDQGVPDLVSASIPTTFEGFKRYIDSKRALLPYEGIWEEPNGMYTLGFVPAIGDARYKYYAFVIDSRRSAWQPGEIKAKLSDINPHRITTGEYRTGTKASIGISLEAKGRTYLSSVAEVFGSRIDFIKTYPSETEDYYTGMGTGWAITSNGVFISNAHVVEGASKIFVGFKENAQEARVLALDQKLDLAVLQLLDLSIPTVPFPVKTDAAGNGEEITVMGYPMAFELGDTVKVTTGVISAQAGIYGDITRYQMSAPVHGGNSGGPVVDSRGNVVAVTVSKLTSDNSGADVDLVNYAVKSAYLPPLLSVAGVTVEVPVSTNAFTSEDIAVRYRTSVLPVWVER